HQFERFKALTLLYFAAAIYSETARRLGKEQLDYGFLLCNHPVFSRRLRDLCRLPQDGRGIADGVPQCAPAEDRRILAAPRSLSEDFRPQQRPSAAGPRNSREGSNVRELLRTKVRAPGRWRRQDSLADDNDFKKLVNEASAPFDVAGLTDPARHPWYPARPEDLLASAGKVGADRDEILAMLRRCRLIAEHNACAQPLAST